ncbi:MAG: UPF0149 family protein [Burkholderiaceae bacterium]|jgi:uncharacterized protein|nr:UPF0149 family protein [Burkholderiaceae bacterium]
MSTATTPCEPTDRGQTSPETHVHDPVGEAAVATISALENALDAIAQRHPEDTPQWEYCEGFMTALLCMRRAVSDDEWLVALFSHTADELFADPSEHIRFLTAWTERESQLRSALTQSIDAPDEELPFYPYVLDWRGMLGALSEEERAVAMQDGPPPPLGLLWATGFTSVVITWLDDWALPRDKELATAMIDALESIHKLLDDDCDPPALNLHDPHAAPSASDERSQAFIDAIAGVSALFDIARILGPRVPQLRNQDKRGRNDPCPCGSGKKYKKCCGQ